MNRYSRQIRLEGVGLEGQARLGAARVLCVGVGGLGSPAALYLAAAGVGTIGLIDDDCVDESNLQRQILFKVSDRSQSKVICAKRRLLELNPEIQIQTHLERLTKSNAEWLFESYDLVIDGSDNFETKFLVNDASYRTRIPWVYAAVNRFEGQVAFFLPENGPCYRCLYPSKPKAEVRNCAETGVLGSVVGTLGTLQATLALQYLISKGSPEHSLRPQAGSLTLFDFSGPWNISTVQISKRADCSTCSKHPQEVGLESNQSSCDTPQIDQWSAQDVKNAKARFGKSMVFIDVRSIDEWRSGHIRGAFHWPLSQIKAQMEQSEFPTFFSQQSETIVYCQTGVRSLQAARLLKTAGIRSVRSLLGGIENWSEDLVCDESS